MCNCNRSTLKEISAEICSNPRAGCLPILSAIAPHDLRRRPGLQTLRQLSKTHVQTLRGSCKYGTARRTFLIPGQKSSRSDLRFCEKRLRPRFSPPLTINSTQLGWSQSPRIFSEATATWVFFFLWTNPLNVTNVVPVLWNLTKTNLHRKFKSCVLSTPLNRNAFTFLSARSGSRTRS